MGPKPFLSVLLGITDLWCFEVSKLYVTYDQLPEQQAVLCGDVEEEQPDVLADDAVQGGRGAGDTAEVGAL